MLSNAEEGSVKQAFFKPVPLPNSIGAIDFFPCTAPQSQPKELLSVLAPDTPELQRWKLDRHDLESYPGILLMQDLRRVHEIPP